MTDVGAVNKYCLYNQTTNIRRIHLHVHVRLRTQYLFSVRQTKHIRTKTLSGLVFENKKIVKLDNFATANFTIHTYHTTFVDSKFSFTPRKK